MLRKVWKFIKGIVNNLRRWQLGYLLAAFGASLWLSVWALRQNSLHMVELRDAVVAADANNGDVEKALKDLRNYVGRHMNTNLRSKSQFATNEPPIQLVNAYNKAVREAQEKAAQANGNTALYAEAEANCTSRGVPLTAIAQCIQDYIAARTNNPNPQVAAKIPKELYTYDFISPKWSPDLAGFSVLTTIGFALLLLERLIVKIRERYLLRG